MSKRVVISLLLFHAFLSDGALAIGDEWLLERFSSRWTAIRKEMVDLESRLNELPSVTVEDFGGMRGFRSKLMQPDAVSEIHPLDIFVRWDTPQAIDMIVLVPARNYDDGGLDAQFGLPDDFSVELLNADGTVVRHVARERAVWSHPVRNGHPFVYALEEPVVASGVRLRSYRLHAHVDRSDFRMRLAWAEMFCYSGEKNVALGAQVDASGSAHTSHWLWKPKFMVDGVTPLGPQEVPAPDHGGIGWFSVSYRSPDETAWVQLDLGSVQKIDGVRLYPTLQPLTDLVPGFGFPQQFTIDVWETSRAKGGRTVYTQPGNDVLNPGNHPVLIRFPSCKARHVEIHATRLWHIAASYPSYLGFAEIEVLNGEKNLAMGAAVRVSSRKERVPAAASYYWIPESLTDGFGPRGRLMGAGYWLLQDERLRLETQLHHLKNEAADLMKKYLAAVHGLLVFLGTGGVVLLLLLPLRYYLLKRSFSEALRLRVAGDLHDDIGSSLGSIQILAETARTHAEPAPYLDTIRTQAAECVASVRDMVWVMRSPTLLSDGWGNHLRETAEIMLDGLDCDFRIEKAALACRFDSETWRNLFLFYREALHNIIRHSQASRVSIHIAPEGKGIRIVIQDDGVGIAPERLTDESTLLSLRQRAKRLKADFQVGSPPEGGLLLTLLVPLHKHRFIS